MDELIQMHKQIMALTDPLRMLSDAPLLDALMSGAMKNEVRVVLQFSKPPNFLLVVRLA